MALVSIRQYAKDRKCSDTAVHKAIRSHKIVEGVVHDDKGRPRIDPEVADREWGQHINEDSRNQKLASLTKAPSVEVKDRPAMPSGNPVPTGGGISGDLAKARLSQAISKAKLLDQDFKKKSGALVERDKVYASLFSAGQEVKASLQTIPDRHIDEILSAPSRNDAHTILYNAIAEALETLADLGKRELVPRT